MADFAFKPPKDVLAKTHTSPETAHRQADRLIAAGHKVRVWEDGKKLIKESPLYKGT